MKTCYVMVGLPGLGKSTRVKDISYMSPDAFVYSTDDMIEHFCKMSNMTYDEGYEQFNKPALKAMNGYLDLAIRAGLDVVWDQTNLGLKKRAKIIRRMRQSGYSVVCEYFLKPTEERDIKTWNARLASRPGKTISTSTIERMENHFVEPTLAEGFDEIIFWQPMSKKSKKLKGN